MDVKKEFLDILRDYVEADVDTLDTSASFKFGIGLDSFALMALVAAIEEHFGVSIPNADMKQFKTIDDMIAYLERVKK